MSNETSDSGLVPSEVRHVPEELRDLACSNNVAELAVVCFFASHKRYPSYDEFESTLQSLFAKTVSFQNQNS